MLKPAALLAFAVIFASTAFATYVDLATPENSANLIFSITDSELAWTVPAQPVVLADASYTSASLQRTDSSLQLSLGLHDKESAIALAEGPVGPDFAYQQLSLSFFKFTEGEVTFSAGTLSIAIDNLFSAEAAQIDGFIFTGPDALANANAWDATYSAVDGTLTFTNTAAFTVSPDESLWLYGQFNVVPEPANFAALVGLLGAGYAALSRRRPRD